VRKKGLIICLSQLGIGAGVLAIAFALTETLPPWAGYVGSIIYIFSLWKNY